jgi:hypothetical protein
MSVYIADEKAEACVILGRFSHLIGYASSSLVRMIRWPLKEPVGVIRLQRLAFHMGKC